MGPTVIRLALAGAILALGASIAAADQVTLGGVAETDPNDLSQAFWTDWNTVKSSAAVTELTAKIGGAASADDAVAAASKTKTQAIVPIAISQPQDAAKLLGTAATSGSDPITANALATVVNLRVAPATRKAAVAYVPPAVKTQVEHWNADLSSGIRGLPGIYLGDTSAYTGGSLPPAPAGYQPVAGGSLGCQAR